MVQSSGSKRWVGWWPTWRSAVVDVLVVLVAVVECALEVLYPPALDPPLQGVPAGAAGFAAAAVFLLRRRNPLGVTVVAVIVFFLTGFGVLFMLPAGLYALAAYGRSRPVQEAATAMAAFSVASSLWLWHTSELKGYGWAGIAVPSLVLQAAGVLLGRYAATRFPARYEPWRSRPETGRDRLLRWVTTPRPSEPGQPVAWWPTRRSAVLDAVLALVAAVECAYEAFDAIREFHKEGMWLGVPSVLAAAGGFAVGSVLVLRRRYPIGVVVVATLLPFVAGGMGQWFMYPVSIYTLGAYSTLGAHGRSWRDSVTVGIVSVLLLAFGTFHFQGISWTTLSVFHSSTFQFMAPFLLGLFVGALRPLIVSLRERAEQLERERLLLAQQAVVAERTRLAREMHDVVAHRVGLMVVHANAVEALAAGEPQAAAKSAHLVGEMGRQALDELRHVLGILRLGGEADDQVTQPTMADLTGLVEQSRAVGLPVDFTIQGGLRPIGRVMESTVYRLVQEALTNVVKHAGAAPAKVGICYLPEAVEVVVENECPRHPQPSALPSGGYGLLGMRERVTTLGGTFAAGTTDAGGFRVAATIPVSLSLATPAPAASGSPSASGPRPK